jgi:hypothetical protein
MQRSETIELNGATAASVNISMAAGELQVSGGASGLMEADFTYDEELEPLIDYQIDNGLGILGIRQESGSRFRTTRNEWDIHLNDGLPVDLRVGLAAATGNLSLDGLTLSGLDINSAAGDAVVSAAGDQSRLERVAVDTASGDVKMNLGGRYATATSVAVRSAAGDIKLDLGGTWERDLDVNVDTVAGDVEILVPAAMGVAVQSTSMVGRVRFDGSFQRTGNAQVNAAFGSASVAMRLKITTISGSVNVREVD